MFIPLTELKDTTRIVDICEQFRDEPIFVTRNGTPELVLMHVEFFAENLRYRDAEGKIDIKREFMTVPLSIQIRELKNTGKVSELCLETQKPISIIRNGYEVMVIMSIETYERRIAQV